MASDRYLSVTMTDSVCALAASHAEITPEQAQRAVTSALRSLHRVALTQPRGLTDVALEARIEFGEEACYHLFGLLELERLKEDHELPWSETLLRIDPHMQVYRVLVDRWLNEGNDNEMPPE